MELLRWKVKHIIIFGLNPFMLKVEIFEFVHEIRVCCIGKYKDQEYEEKKIITFHCWVIWRSTIGTLGKSPSYIIHIV